MTPPKIMIMFAQDAAGTREPRKAVRKVQGYDIRKGMTRGLKSDTGQDVKRYAR